MKLLMMARQLFQELTGNWGGIILIKRCLKILKWTTLSME